MSQSLMVLCHTAQGHLFPTQSQVCMMSGLIQQLICTFLKLDYKAYFISAGGAAEQTCLSNCG